MISEIEFRQKNRRNLLESFISQHEIPRCISWFVPYPEAAAVEASKSELKAMDRGLNQ